jgi:hypothetical protein
MTRPASLVPLFALSVCAACGPWMPPQSAAGEPAIQASATESDDMAPAALVEFRSQLEPYGRWVVDPAYGTVWIPSPDAVGPDFAPYVTGGHWALRTDDQWVWLSDYAWGATPFHYGRWFFIDGTGWAWIPGHVYAPAWVVWRTGHDDEAYVGWGPMPPAWFWRDGVAVRASVPMPARYVFVKSRDAFETNVPAHVVPAERVAQVASRTQPFVAPAGGARYGAIAQARAPSPAAARVPATAVPTERVPYPPAHPGATSATSRAPAVQRQPAVLRPGAAAATVRRAPQSEAPRPTGAGVDATQKVRPAPQNPKAAQAVPPAPAVATPPERPAQPQTEAPRSAGAGVDATQNVRPAPQNPKAAQTAPVGEKIKMPR